MQSATSNHEAALQAARDAAVLFDLSDWSQIRISGADRAGFLHNFCTADIKRLGDGVGCEAFLTDIKGRVLAHLLIAELDAALWIIGSPGTESAVIAHLDRYLITEDVALEGLSASTGLLLLVGPDAPAIAEQELACGASLPMYGARRGQCGEHNLRAMAVPVAAPPALAISARREAITAIREHLDGIGVSTGVLSAFEALRIDAGIPLSGLDVTDANLAQEAGRTAQAISFTKGCYLGQEPIARLDALGHVNRELRSLRIEGPPPVAGAPVLDTAGETVGEVTSAAPSGAGSVALAMLRSRCTKPDTTVTVGEERLPARVYWRPLDGRA